MSVLSRVSVLRDTWGNINKHMRCSVFLNGGNWQTFLFRQFFQTIELYQQGKYPGIVPADVFKRFACFCMESWFVQYLSKISISYRDFKHISSFPTVSSINWSIKIFGIFKIFPPKIRYSWWRYVRGRYSIILYISMFPYFGSSL